MGTFYSLYSRFTARKGVRTTTVRAWLDEKNVREPYGSVLAKASEELSFEAMKEGRTIVALGWATHSSYATTRAVDEEWVELAKEFADFEEGPVVAESGGEDYDYGPSTWYIGPEKAVIHARLATLRSEIDSLLKERVELRKKLRKAGTRVIATLQ